jgi:DNA-binding NarL/FixJ family response regulator
MNSASISADIISYTSLSKEDKRNIESEIKKLLELLADKYKDQNFFGRIIKGDYIECAINNSNSALRIALLLKTLIKSINLKNNTNAKGIKYYKEHAIRLAVAIAPLTTIDSENGIIDGEAIYMSGRAIQDFSTSEKQKIVIKNTMFFCSRDNKIKEVYDTIFSLLDNIISKCSAKQSQVIYFRLLGLSEKEISQKLNKNQSTISQHSTSAGWQSIEKAINFFEKNIN